MQQKFCFQLTEIRGWLLVPEIFSVCSSLCTRVQFDCSGLYAMFEPMLSITAGHVVQSTTMAKAD